MLLYMKVIAYSLFGYNSDVTKNSEQPIGYDAFSFNSYLRGLMVNIRLARLIYPDWTIRLHLDNNTYEGFKDLFDKLPIQIVICDDAVLTKAMLWRLKPCFDTSVTHVICRDLDSPITYREAQAVKYWMNKDKTAHAITDSVSHDVPMLGGMIGFIPKYFTSRTGFSNWDEMVAKGGGYERKGADQTFLTNVIYPKVAQHGFDSITQHYVLGMSNSFLSDYHNTIQDMELDIPTEYKETRDICGHIGSAGYYNAQLSRFVNKHADKFTDLIEIELAYPDLFTWVKNGCY